MKLIIALWILAAIITYCGWKTISLKNRMKQPNVRLGRREGPKVS